jgi:hypothetical protein
MHQLPCVGNSVSLAPCARGASDLSMEGEGKAAEGRVVAAHVGCFVCLCDLGCGREWPVLPRKKRDSEVNVD